MDNVFLSIKTILLLFLVFGVETSTLGVDIKVLLMVIYDLSKSISFHVKAKASFFRIPENASNLKST